MASQVIQSGRELVALRVAAQRPPIKEGDTVSSRVSAGLRFSRLSGKERTVAHFYPAQELSNGFCAGVSFPGPFTPVCTFTHRPQILETATKLNEVVLKSGKGIPLYCFATGNRDVMWAWAGPDTVAKMVPDFLGDLALAFGEAIDKANSEDLRDLGLIWPRGYFIFYNGKLIEKGIEPDATKCTVTSGESLYERVTAQAKNLGLIYDLRSNDHVQRAMP